MAKLTRTEIRSLSEDISVELEALKQRYFNEYKQLFVESNFFQILNNKIQTICTSAVELGIYEFLCDVATEKDTTYYNSIHDSRRLFNRKDFKEWIIKQITDSINSKFPKAYTQWEIDRKITIDNVTTIIPDVFKLNILNEYEDRCKLFIEQTENNISK